MGQLGTNMMTGQKQNSVAAMIPAPVGGINAVAALAQMDAMECVYAFNILAEDFGMEVRDGYAEWANGWTGGIARTVITFEGNIPADDRIWVANEEGIWDVTTEGTTAPVQKVAFASPLNNAGICSFVNFTNDGNDRFVLLCDGQNGYYTYTQTTDTWVKIAMGAGIGEIDGIDPDLFDFIMIWKNRVWFVERDSGNAWYLDAGTFAGAVTKFVFGQQFIMGGSLRSMYNWTLDGGVGIDDYLIAVSGAGDVVIYEGTDPAAPETFGLKGSWNIGSLPAGNRNGTEFGGEVYLLSVYGLLPLSQLLNGSSANDPQSYLTRKVSPYIRVVLDDALTSYGWHVHVHPKQSLLFINSPPRLSFDQLAFTMYYGNQSWSMIRGLPKSHTGNWRGEVYWSDININKLYIQRGHVDQVFLDPEADGQPVAIEWDLLTSYQAMGDPSSYKRVQYIRPNFVAGSNPSFEVQARYDYDLSEPTGSPGVQTGGGALWDAGLWGFAEWAGGADAFDNPRGARGLGRHVAVVMRGRSGVKTNFIAFDVTVDKGGIM